MFIRISGISLLGGMAFVLGCSGSASTAPSSGESQLVALNANPVSAQKEERVYTARLSTTLGGCNGSGDSGGTYGTVEIQWKKDALMVKVKVKGREPNTSYSVNVTCSDNIGEFLTDSEGSGGGVFRTNPAVWQGGKTISGFAIDLHQTAAPYPDRAQTPSFSITLP